ILLLAGCRQRTERAPMERLIERKHAELRPGVCTRELQTSFNRFGSAVCEESAIESGNLAQLLGKPALVFVIQQIGAVNGPFDLFSKYLFDARMVVSQGVYRNPSQQIQVAFIRFINQIRARSAVGEKFVPAVGPQQILPL